MATREFWFQYRTTIPPPAEGRRPVRVWIPRPTQSSIQTIAEERLTGPDLERRREERFGNEILYAELPGNGAEEVLTQRYRVRRSSASAQRPPAEPGAAPPLEVRRYLDADSRVPISGPVVAEAAAVGGGLPPAAALRRVFDHLLDTFEYDPRGCTLDRAEALGDLPQMCELGSGTCTDWHGLLVAWMRSLGTPARFCFGFNIPAGKSSGTIAGYHCWAEVYLPGVGWFPVDVTEAKKRPEERERFFGGLDEHRVAFTTGRDVRLDPLPAASSVDKFIFPHVEQEGRPIRFQVAFSFEPA